MYRHKLDDSLFIGLLGNWDALKVAQGLDKIGAEMAAEIRHAVEWLSAKYKLRRPVLDENMRPEAVIEDFNKFADQVRQAASARIQEVAGFVNQFTAMGVIYEGSGPLHDDLYTATQLLLKVSSWLILNKHKRNEEDFARLHQKLGANLMPLIDIHYPYGGGADSLVILRGGFWIGEKDALAGHRLDNLCHGTFGPLSGWCFEL